MTFATPLGLLALAAIPAIIVIHIFRRRYPVRTIAGLFLWQTGLQTPAGGGRPERLPVTPSLLLECLAALALALTFALAWVFQQTHVTLPLSMASRGLPPSAFGTAIAINGVMIVALQLFVTPRLAGYPAASVMSGAALLTATIVPVLLVAEKGREWGWGSGLTLGLTAVAVERAAKAMRGS